MSVLFGIIVGLALGLTGGGGSIFAVLLLIYGLGVAPHSAVSISLAAVALTAAFGAAQAWYAGLVESRAALILAAAGMLSAPLGVWFGGRVSENAVLVAFAILMVLVASHMAFKAGRSPSQASVVRAQLPAGADHEPGVVCRYSPDGRLRLNTPCSLALWGAGLVVGALSGFFGVGDGFLIVPALMLITAMGIHRAVATSLLVISLIGISGVAASVLSGRDIDWCLAGLFVAGGLLGMAGAYSRVVLPASRSSICSPAPC